MGNEPRGAGWRGEPLWLLLVLGALAGDVTWLAWRARREPCGAAPAAARDFAGGAEAGALRLDLARASQRELRALPGIGERRAAAIVERRWQLPPGAPGFALTEVEGVGPGIQERVRRELWDPDGLAAREPAVGAVRGSSVHSRRPTLGAPLGESAAEIPTGDPSVPERPP